MSSFHPELQARARWLRLVPLHARILRAVDRVYGLRGTPRPPRIADVRVQDYTATAHDGAPLRVRLYQPASRVAHSPALLWIHGGGYVMGWPEQDEESNIDCVRRLGITVAAVQYRRAPEYPFPTPLEDCYSALDWLYQRADELQLDRSRLAVGGASAGGGLAAAVTQLALDRAQVAVRFQLLIYPMLDDRSAVRGEAGRAEPIVWTRSSNLYGWSAYLGHRAGEPEPRQYAVPARRRSLQGLPAAWIGVGDADLFYAECVQYAQRLKEARVPCEVQVVPGAFHGFDMVGRETQVAQAFRAAYLQAMRSVLSV